MNKSWMKKINGNWEQMVRLSFEPRFIHDVNSSVFYVFYTKPGYQCLSLRTVKRFMYPWFTPWNDRTVTCDVRQNLVKTVNKKVTILILISFCKNSKQDRSICILLASYWNDESIWVLTHWRMCTCSDLGQFNRAA